MVDSVGVGKRIHQDRAIWNHLGITFEAWRSIGTRMSRPAAPAARTQGKSARGAAVAVRLG